MSEVENVIKTTSFNPTWEELYFCTEFEGGVRCLICLKKLHKVSKYNIRRHYLTFHAEEYKDLDQEKRITEIARLKADPPVFFTKHHFNPEWEELYFFIGNESHSTCLICLKTLNYNRKYNVQRHYSRYHEDQFGALGKEERLAKLEELIEKYLKTTVHTQESEENELLEIKEHIRETIKNDK
ncbi:hypothetical protein C0J52_10410 [Blattella germanica]|nr:hypothetical protein C0J52_10410 [Blattella germanica]